MGPGGLWHVFFLICSCFSFELHFEACLWCLLCTMTLHLGSVGHHGGALGTTWGGRVGALGTSLAPVGAAWGALGVDLGARRSFWAFGTKTCSQIEADWVPKS